MRAPCSHIPPLQYPGQALSVALYEFGGVRGCEIGTVMFGRQPDGSEVAGAMDLVRLAMPRRVYTQRHADYLIEVFAEVTSHAANLRGMRITYEAPADAPFHGQLRAFVRVEIAHTAR